MRIGFLGGGSFGHELAQRFVDAGHNVLVGLRDTRKANPSARYRVGSLLEAANADVVVVAVLYSAAFEVLSNVASRLQGKVVIDATNALNADWTPCELAPHRSAADRLSQLFPGIKLVKAFNTIFADAIPSLEKVPPANRLTAFIASDHDHANQIVAGLAIDAGLLPIITGGLINARYLEAMAHLNIQIAVVNGGGTRAGFIYRQHL